MGVGVETESRRPSMHVLVDLLFLLLLPVPDSIAAWSTQKPLSTRARVLFEGAVAQPDDGDQEALMG